jgi:hypothetical protein
VKKTVSLVLAAVVFFMILFICISCGKGAHISKILREDASEASMNWLFLIKEYGVNYVWDDSTLLGEAIKAGRVDMVKALIKDGVDVKRPSTYFTMFGTTIGFLPLQQAAIHTTGSIADRLMGIGSTAPIENLAQIAVLLIKNGAPVKYENFDVLQYAISSGDNDFFEAALSKYTKDMLDYSGYTGDNAKNTAFSGFSVDENFDRQKSMLDRLRKKNIQFGFYDIAKAIKLYTDPESKQYLNPSVLELIEYMAKQDKIQYIYEQPEQFSEDNPHMVSAFDLAIGSIYIAYTGKTATEPDAYINTISLFGDISPDVFPYYWEVEGDFRSRGPIAVFFDIMASKINNEGKHRIRVASAEQANQNRSHGEALIEVEPFADIFQEWNAETIINAFEALSKYNALYYQNNNDKKPLDDFCDRITNQEDMDLVKPYYSVFDWLVQHGYNIYGTKNYLVYEDSNGAEDFFLNYHTRALWKNTPLNNPNDPEAIPLSYLKRMANGNYMWNSIYKEALEILDGKIPGFSESSREWISRSGSYLDSKNYTWHYYSANVKP